MQLRVLTANLFNGRARPESFAEVLHDLQPDVVAVQELSENCAAVLRDWGESRLLDPDDETTGMGMAIRAAATFERLPFPNRHPIRAVFDGGPWGLGTVEVIGAHLVNPLARPWRKSRQLRAAELDAIARRLAEPADVRLVVGDLNSSPIWPLYRQLTTMATDAAVAAGTARATWSYLSWTPPLLRIDHVFVQGARPLRTEPVRIRGTDHLGLVADLTSAVD